MRFVPPKPTIPEIDTSTFVSLSQAERKALASSANVRKYTDKYTSSKEKIAEEMAKQKAADKRKKRIDFLVELVKAAIIALLTLTIEHIGDIVSFVQLLLH